MLPSSKSPSRCRAVPFLAASRSISAWGETTVSGPSAPRWDPRRGGLPDSRSLRLKAQRRAHGWQPLPSRSHCSCPPAARVSRVLPHLNLKRVLAAAAAGVQTWTLLAPARPRLPQASSASDASRCGGGRGPEPAGELPQAPLALQAPAPPARRPRHQGRTSTLPPTQASCQQPAAQHQLQPISPPMPLLAGNGPLKVTVTPPPR